MAKKAKAATPAKTAPKRTTKAMVAGRAAARASAPRSGRVTASGKGTVSIRMYRGLLGDFFLLKHTVGEQVFKMLIDCGVLQCIGSQSAKPSTSLGKERIKAAVADLMRDTGGQIDLVVATHEHYDHLSGFILANDSFKPLKIGQVWMAWTEDRRDKLANSYRSKKNKAIAALSALVRNPALAATDEIETVKNLLQFHGDIDPLQVGMLGAAKPSVSGELAGNASCEAVLEWLKGKAGQGNVHFLEPGQAVSWGVGDAFRAYVLGPPREDAMLRKLDPSKGQAREVYLSRGEDVETVSALAAVHGDRVGDLRQQDQPFARPHWRPYDVNIGEHKKASATKNDPIIRIYEARDAAERRIDTEWLGSAENLALKIDGDVNNTSLALALELTNGEVLLFPADAQVGNWLSWGAQDYPADERRGGPNLKIEELLSRTILYKVGHHASHNATLRERGLELMTDPRLCAMIPLVEKTAREQTTKSAPNGWAMPYGDLYARLEARTGGRILRGDGNTGDETSRFRKSIFRLDYGNDLKAKDPLWVELTLDLA